MNALGEFGIAVDLGLQRRQRDLRQIVDAAEPFQQFGVARPFGADGDDGVFHRRGQFQAERLADVVDEIRSGLGE
ncbi:hypothetical protein IU453_02550 [Nocardia cyriacigeorgica]|uniref:hypothetical protein n=1 Tax=Nocardia cyriacigeorgica TaxID=135487 RepID=UPI00189359E5|nr:hypothetical protein [Nocardia cyriacigeorgica]MBF6315659.1 hypothetical protein [Nocardia cyriacigeorgica]MBF6530444.1 hypothetical protein [Nocardia cyriacigeorgica]